MSEINKINQEYNNINLSIIILISNEKDDLSAVIKSLIVIKDKISELIIADAVGNLFLEKIMQNIKNSLCSVKVKYYDLSQNIYQNNAHLKNDCVKLAQCDRIMIINASDNFYVDKDFNTLKVCDSDAEDNLNDCFLLYKKLLIAGKGILRNIIVSRSALDVVGGWNTNLNCGEDYELALRICDYGLDRNLNFVEGCLIDLNRYDADVTMFREDYYTYAYIIAKYATRLRTFGIFDEVFLKRYNEAVRYNIENYFVSCQENFMTNADMFNNVDCTTRPVLVFTEKGVCNDALYYMANEFVKALRAHGQNVYTCMLDSDDNLKNISRIGNIAKVRLYKAAVEFQAGVFSAQLSKGELIGNIFKCPKFMFEFDHPLYISWHFMVPVKDYYVLSQDETYAEFLRKYFPYVKGAWHFPLPGQQAEKEIEKEYDFTFVGTYSDYRKNFAKIRKMPENARKICLGMLKEFKKNPNLTAERCLEIILEKNNITLNKREFIILLHKMHLAVGTITFYYREKVIKNIIDAGIEIHVFSDTWKEAPYAVNDIVNIGLHFFLKNVRPYAASCNES